MSDRLIFALSRPPLPLSNGSRIRSHRLLQGLSRHFHVTLITFEHDPRSPDGGFERSDIERVLPDVEIGTAPGRGPRVSAADAEAVVDRSWAFGRYRRPQFERLLASAISRRNPAIAHSDDLGVGQFGPASTVLSTFATHNIEHRIVERSAAGTRRAFASVEWRKLRFEERRVWRRIPLCLAVSDLAARTMFDGGTRLVELCPNGTHGVARFPSQRRRSDEPLRLLFVGSADYQAYERASPGSSAKVLPRLQYCPPPRRGARPASAAGADGRRQVRGAEPQRRRLVRALPRGGGADVRGLWHPGLTP